MGQGIRKNEKGGGKKRGPSRIVLGKRKGRGEADHFLIQKGGGDGLKKKGKCEKIHLLILPLRIRKKRGKEGRISLSPERTGREKKRARDGSLAEGERNYDHPLRGKKKTAEGDERGRKCSASFGGGGRGRKHCLCLLHICEGWTKGEEERKQKQITLALRGEKGKKGFKPSLSS